MPINTYICPNCGARVNHTVRQLAEPQIKYDGETGERIEIDSPGQLVICPRCKTEHGVVRADISERTVADIGALDAFDSVMSDDENVRAILEDDGGDAVEAALNKADAVFGNAKRALDDIQLESVSNTIDADELLNKYQIPDVKNFAFTKAREKVVAKGVAKGYSEENVGMAYDAAANLLQEHIPNSRFSSVLDRFASGE